MCSPWLFQLIVTFLESRLKANYSAILVFILKVNITYFLRMKNHLCGEFVCLNSAEMSHAKTDDLLMWLCEHSSLNETLKRAWERILNHYVNESSIATSVRDLTQFSVRDFFL